LALIFLDIRKAFEYVSHKKLVKKLDYFSICGVANYLLTSYLDKRKQYRLINDFTSSKSVVEFGIPQGSILGSLMFLIYINDLPSCLKATYRFFADDTALFVVEKTPESVLDLANSEL